MDVKDPCCQPWCDRTSHPSWQLLFAPSWNMLHQSGTSYQEDIQRIEMVQRRAAQWVLSDYSPYSSVSDMLGRLGWHTLEQWHADSRLVLFYKIVHGLVAILLPTYVITFNCYSQTTHSLAFRQLYVRTDYYKYSFFPLAVVQWNNLSASTATLTNFDSFKLAVSQEYHHRP